MSNELKIKSNGLRNELKEIRKSIDKLTNAILMAQTHKRYEKVNHYDLPDHNDRYGESKITKCSCGRTGCDCESETGRSFGI